MLGRQKGSRAKNKPRATYLIQGLWYAFHFPLDVPGRRMGVFVPSLQAKELRLT
jgi:hypothetical protein